MADYTQYSNPSSEWKALGHFEPNLPEPIPLGRTLEQVQQELNKKRRDAVAKEFESSGLKVKTSYYDYSIPARDGSQIPARLYVGKEYEDHLMLPLYLYYHGGGYMMGDIEGEDMTCAEIVTTMPIRMLHVNYRHTPQVQYPTFHNDAEDGFFWALEQAETLKFDASKIIVGGVSAGGGLAASVMLREHERPGKSRIMGQILLTPWLLYGDAYPFHLFASKEVSSLYENRDAPNLPLTWVERFTEAMGVANYADPHLSVAIVDEEKVKGMPKSVLFVAGRDPLRDDALLYAEKLQRNNVPTQVHIFPGLPHGFRRFQQLSATKKWVEVVKDSLNWILSEAGSHSNWIIEQEGTSKL